MCFSQSLGILTAMSRRTSLAAAFATIMLGIGLLPASAGAVSLGDKLIQDAKSCSLSDVQQDLANGAKVNATHPNGRTALMMTGEWCSTTGDIASTLIDHGANVNAKDKKGMTALMYAASVDNDEVAKVLLAHGADVNAKANDGSTALSITQSDPMGPGEVASLLQAAGAQ
jgi:ankyrin repeat protein